MKKLKSLLSYVLVAVMLLGMMPMASAAEGPSVSITQETATNVGAGVYKLVFAVTAQASSDQDYISTINPVIAYDNTVIVPANCENGTALTIADSSSSEDMCFNHLIRNGAFPKVTWNVSGTKTVFDVSAFTTAGTDCSSETRIFEFYFKLVNGKSATDMNSGTFALAESLTAVHGSILVGTKSSASYYYNYTDGDDTLTLSSFTYTNYDVKTVGSLELGTIYAVAVPALYELNNSTAKTEAATVTPVLTVKDTAGGTIASGESAYPTITWSIAGTNPDSSKISINSSTGVLSVAPGAKEGTVTIQAAGAGKTVTKSFSVSRDTAAATLLTISGDSSVTVPTSGNTQKTYTATVLDQYGDAFTGTTTWSATGTETGVTFADGTLTVANTATTASVEITATNGSATATKSVSVARETAAATTVTVGGGQADILVPADGADAITSTAFTASVTDQYGTDYTGTVTWSIAPATSGVSIGSDGVVRVTNAAKAAITDTTGTSFTITATCGNVSDTETITVKRDTAAATSVVIYNNAACTSATGATDTLVIPTTSTATEKQYYAKTYDQYGAEFSDTYTWSFATADDYVTHTTGKVSVAQGATVNNTYALTATGTSTKTASVTITVKDISVNWDGIAVKSSITYGDSKASAFTTLPATGTATAVGDLAGTFSIDDASTILTAGSRTITVKFTVTTAGDYKDVVITKDYTVTVNPKPITVTVTAASREYGAANPTFAATAATGALVGEDTIAGLNLTLSSTANSTSAPGAYDVTGTASNSNYTVTVSGTGKLTVTRAALTLTGTPSFTAILANSADNNDLDALKAAVLAANPTLAASYANGTTTLTPTWSLKTGTYDRKGGTYTFEATLAPTDDTNFSYSGAKAEVSVTVTAVTGTYNYTPATLTKAEAEIDAAATIAALGLPTSIAVTYDNSVTDGPYSITGWNYTLAELQAVNASAADVQRDLVPTVEFPAWATIDTSGLKTVLTITSKYPVTVNVAAPAGITYGGTLGDPTPSQVAIDNGIDDVSPDWTYLYEGTTRAGTAYSSADKPTAAGTYTVTATLVSDTHSGNNKSSEFTIAPKALANSMIDITGTYTFTGSALTPTYTVTDGELLVAGDYTVAITDNVNVGNGTITITASDKGNYTGTASKTFAIAKADAPTVDNIAREYNYTTPTTGVSIDLAALLPNNRGTTTYNLTKSGTATTSGATVDANGILSFDTITGTADDAEELSIVVTMQNYEAVTVKVTVKLVAKATPVGTPVVTGTLSYGQKLSTLSISAEMDNGSGDAVLGTITWEAPDSIPVVGAAAQAWIFTPEDDATYSNAYGTAAITVSKSVPSGTPTYDAISTGGKTLADANLDGVFTNQYNSEAVPGRVVWDDALTTEVTANTAYDWTFTPYDTANYEIATGSITPYSVSSGGTPGTTTGEETVKEPETAGNSTSVTVETESKTVGNTTTASVSEDSISKAIESVLDAAQAAGSSNAALVITIDAPANAAEVALSIPADSFSDIAGSDVDSLTISTPVGDLTFDEAALNAIAAQAGGEEVEIIIKQVTPTSSDLKEIAGDGVLFEFVVKVDGKEVSDFGAGKVEVSLPFTLNNAEDANKIGVWHIDGNMRKTRIGKAIYDAVKGAISFFTNHFSYYLVEVNELEAWENPYADVKESDWFFEAVRYVSANDLMQGTGAGKFEPNTTLNRAMLATVLWRIEGEPSPQATNPFTDLKQDWYKNAVIWASENGIVEGYGNGLFGPADALTREQMATMLYRYAQYKKQDTSKAADLSKYKDASGISDWALNAMKWANAEGLITGRSATTLAPEGVANRAELATIMMRYLDK